MTKQAILDQIKADILTQNICPDLAKSANQLVFGTGNPDAEVVFIGEAPGKNEDLKGLPFVGAAGKFLDQMLDAAVLKRSDIYITNIVKYRPPKNRDPRPDEKAAFLPFLYVELAAIAPKFIVTMGRHSTNCFLPDVQISDIHGQCSNVTFEAGGKEIQMTVFASYHPAAAIYNRSLRTTLIEDFQKLPNIINKIKK